MVRLKKLIVYSSILLLFLLVEIISFNQGFGDILNFVLFIYLWIYFLFTCFGIYKREGQLRKLNPIKFSFSPFYIIKIIIRALRIRYVVMKELLLSLPKQDLIIVCFIFIISYLVYRILRAYLIYELIRIYSLDKLLATYITIFLTLGTELLYSIYKVGLKINNIIIKSLLENKILINWVKEVNPEMLYMSSLDVEKHDWMYKPLEMRGVTRPINIVDAKTREIVSNQLINHIIPPVEVNYQVEVKPTAKNLGLLRQFTNFINLYLPKYQVSMDGKQAYLLQEASKYYDTGTAIIPYESKTYLDTTHIDNFINAKTDYERGDALINNAHNMRQNYRLYKMLQVEKTEQCPKKVREKLIEIRQVSTEYEIQYYKEKIEKGLHPALLKFGDKHLSAANQLYKGPKKWEPDKMLYEVPTMYRLNKKFTDYSVLNHETGFKWGEPDNLIINENICEKIRQKATTDGSDFNLSDLVKTLDEKRYKVSNTDLLVLTVGNESSMLDRHNTSLIIPNERIEEFDYKPKSLDNNEESLEEKLKKIKKIQEENKLKTETISIKEEFPQHMAEQEAKIKKLEESGYVEINIINSVKINKKKKN